MTRSMPLLFASVFVVMLGVQTPSQVAEYAPPRARTYAGDVSRPLTGPSTASATAIVAQFLREQGRDVPDASLVVASSPIEAGNGVSTIRLEQAIAGLRVYAAYAKASFTAHGELVYLIENFATAAPATLPAPAISAGQGLDAALRHLYPGQAIAVGAGRANGNSVVFERTAFFHASPRVTRVAYEAADGALRVGMLVETWSDRENQLHHTLVGGRGEVLYVESRTASDSYNVFAISPRVSTQAVASGAGAGNAESPNGWLFAGDQNSISIAGNNVHGYLDAVRRYNVPDEGGVAVGDGIFDAAATLTDSPSTASNREVAVQNLFFHNNAIHDILYRHGFNEAAGNFQETNSTGQGLGSDSVNAEAQDGSGTNNANFATPADGSNPRMQMFLWDNPAQFEVRLNTAPNTSYAAAGAEFGASLRGDGLTGDLVVGQSGALTDGCQALTNAVAGRIVLVDRGTCNFTVKAQYAQSAGAIGLIVANNAGGTDIEPMGGRAPVRIPALMISQNDGAALKALVNPNVTMRPDPDPLTIDSSLDADVIYHEYGHGLSWRMIGGMSGKIAGALGEGISDTVAFLLTDNDRIGEYASTSSLGIRRAPYANYPNTYGDVTGESVHNDGEIYAAIIWRLRELFTGTTEQFLTYLVTAMNFIPATPSYEDMRSGWLQVMPDQASDCLVWSAFAQFGVGEGSSAVVTRRGVTITESFNVPAECQVP